MAEQRIRVAWLARISQRPQVHVYPFFCVWPVGAEMRGLVNDRAWSSTTNLWFQYGGEPLNNQLSLLPAKQVCTIQPPLASQQSSSSWNSQAGAPTVTLLQQSNCPSNYISSTPKPESKQSKYFSTVKLDLQKRKLCTELAFPQRGACFQELDGIWISWPQLLAFKFGLKSRGAVCIVNLDLQRLNAHSKTAFTNIT